MEALHTANLASSSSPLKRPTASFSPIFSVALTHKSSSDRTLQSCPSTGYDAGLTASPSKAAHSGNPISASRSTARSLLSHNDPFAEQPTPSSSRSTILKKTLIAMRNNAAAGYAAALAELGHILSLIYADLQQLGAFLQHKQLHSFLLNPSIHDTHKKNILTRLAEDHAFMPYTLKILILLVNKKRAFLLEDVVKEFEAIYNKITDMEVVIVLSATAMDAAQVAHMAKRIRGVLGSKNVRMKNALDSSVVVAGCIVKHGKNGSHLMT